MRLFYIHPKDPQLLSTWFLLEVILILINYPLFVGFIKLVVNVRAHINLKIIAIFLLAQYFPALTGRLVILGFQSGLFKIGERPEENKLIILCSWYRCYDLSLILSILFWFSIERQFAIVYIRDYEKASRLWIPITITSSAAIACGAAAACYTFEWIPWYPLAFLGLGVTAIGTVVATFSYLANQKIQMFFHTYRSTSKLYEMIKKHKICKHKYSLTIRYQLQENLWCGKHLRNGIISLALVNISTFLVFLPAVSDEGKRYFGEEATQLLDCLYNILIVANGPTMAIGSIAYNDYLLGIISIWWHGKKAAPEEDPGSVYFIQLQQQWDTPFGKEKEEVHRKMKKRPGKKRVTFSDKH